MVQATEFFYAVSAFNSGISNKQNTGMWLTVAVTALLYELHKGTALTFAQWFLHRNIQDIIQVCLHKVELNKPDILLTYVLDPQNLTYVPSPFQLHISSTSDRARVEEDCWRWLEITHCPSSFCLSKWKALMKAVTRAFLLEMNAEFHRTCRNLTLSGFLPYQIRMKLVTSFKGYRGTDKLTEQKPLPSEKKYQDSDQHHKKCLFMLTESTAPYG